MPAPANLVRESSNSTGTGDLTTSAVNGYVRFSDSTYAFGTGGTDAFCYFITNRSAAEWEIGTGHMSDANTLVRDTVLISSNGNAKVNFSAGTKDVCNDIPAGQQVFVEGTLAQGDIIYRGASAWSRLAAGSNGQFLQTQGAGASPQWATQASPGVVLLDSGTLSSAGSLALDLSGYSAYKSFELNMANFVPATDDVELWLQYSTDGGSNFLTSGYSYVTDGYESSSFTARRRNGNSQAYIALLGSTSSADSISNVSSEGGCDCSLKLLRPSLNQRTRALWHGAYQGAGGTGAWFATQVGAGERSTQEVVNAFRVLFESGNIASGVWALYGYS